MIAFFKIPAATLLLVAAIAVSAFALKHDIDLSRAASAPRPEWDEIPYLTFQGALKAFWNVGDGTNDENLTQAIRHGFLPVTLLNTYADYPGGQKENISDFIRHYGLINPWHKPTYFESIVRRNITDMKSLGTYVNDIEVPFEYDAAKAWNIRSIREASGAKTFDEFQKAYYTELATWYNLPLKWTKEIYPGTEVGIYGLQPYIRDFWGFTKRSEAWSKKLHAYEENLWRQVDASADFYVSSIYVFYNEPDSIFYMATNVEENYVRTRKYGNKPVYAYTWLRFDDNNRDIIPLARQLPPYLVEAMAIVPYFSGAKGVVLWGWEPDIKLGERLPYAHLPLFVKSLKRVAALSDKIGKARLVIDKPAVVLWKEKLPLVRGYVLQRGECIAMAVNPWQGEDEETKADFHCGDKDYYLTMRGHHTTIVSIGENGFEEY